MLRMALVIVYIKKCFFELYFLFTTNTIPKKETFDRLIEIWKKSSLPKYAENSALKKLTRYLDVVIILRKCINSPKYEENREKHLAKYDKLFDILSRKFIGHYCACIREKRVPVSEVSFLKDQRYTHSMCIQTQTQSTSIQSKGENADTTYATEHFVSITNYNKF